MAGLLEVIVILWKSIRRNMEKNKEARVYTIDKFASVLPEYLKVFQVKWHICEHAQWDGMCAELVEVLSTSTYLSGPGPHLQKEKAEPAPPL